MKKIFLAGAVLISSLAFSQLNYKAEAGYVNSNISLKPETAMKPGAKSGFYAGLGAERKWGERIAVQIDFDYINLGAKYNIGNETVTLNMNRFQMPFSFKYYATYELGIFAGGFLNMKLSNSVKASSGDSAVENVMKNYLDDKLSGADYGLHFGADYRIIKGMYVTAKYNIGMANLAKDAQNGEEAKMNSLQAGIGYKF